MRSPSTAFASGTRYHSSLRLREQHGHLILARLTIELASTHSLASGLRGGRIAKEVPHGLLQESQVGKGATKLKKKLEGVKEGKRIVLEEWTR